MQKYAVSRVPSALKLYNFLCAVLQIMSILRYIKSMKRDKTATKTVTDLEAQEFTGESSNRSVVHHRTF